ncbi:uncharacterized protein LOC133133725 isoform X4 [Conger conger]|uniref:uncharacterized protein LOC133133725 isoform X4 n=1 Tax=Conger conger TaxID=82655 RepID=UPI002A5A4275|nr:uncharacterized protein LOC133133725 isoform X4 [Conger conger]
MGNGMGPGWILQRDCYVLREKALWSFSHTVGLILHLLLCLHCLSKTAFSTPVQTAWFSPKHRHPVLSIDYPPEDKANPVTQVMWKKLGDKPSRILEQLKSHQSPKYYGRYNNRTHYYFQNNTLILDNILEEDKGIYEVSVVYKNNTIWTKKLHLQFIRSAIELCSPSPAPDLNLKVILSITVAAICVFGVCILILCITHHQGRNMAVVKRPQLHQTACHRQERSQAQRDRYCLQHRRQGSCCVSTQTSCQTALAQDQYRGRCRCRLRILAIPPSSQWSHGHAVKRRACFSWSCLQ